MKRSLTLAAFALFLLKPLCPAAAQENPPAPNAASGPVNGWFARVTRTQAEQPHWITPIATVTPRLEEEFRYDILWQRTNSGTTMENYGAGKGLELIPLERVEVILNIPPYLAHNNPAIPDGFGDFSFLLKYRLFTANEEKGNYILTAFLGVSLPTGSPGNGATDAITTPTIAYGKGWRSFDVQGTIGGTLPTGNTSAIGRTIPWNNAFQYHLWRRFWPEAEVNATFFHGGKNDGQKQVFLTPGLVIGRIHLWKRMGLTFGSGIQIAATHFHTTNHNIIFTVRLPF
ncbi:MAG: hypothetical protein DMG33_12380 [Acidobacteria bacterium]|nr:MAG: hypothetical protein DMG33_12380 [Acidobacteriota bacterium]